MTLKKNSIILSFLFVIFIGILISNLSESNAVFEETRPNTLNLIQENSVMAISEPCYFMSRERAIELLLEEIIQRESGGDPNICNREHGCSAGAGLTGIIPSTEKRCEKALERELDMFNREDNLTCARYLLDTNGIWDWEPYSGSYVDILLELDLYEEMYQRSNNKSKLI